MLNVACFVQSCLTDADFVIFSNYCLIGTRQKASACLFGESYAAVPLRTMVFSYMHSCCCVFAKHSSSQIKA